MNLNLLSSSYKNRRDFINTDILSTIHSLESSTMMSNYQFSKMTYYISQLIEAILRAIFIHLLKPRNCGTRISNKIYIKKIIRRHIFVAIGLMVIELITLWVHLFSLWLKSWVRTYGIQFKNYRSAGLSLESENFPWKYAHIFAFD